MIDTFNNEFKLIEEVMTKSVAQKINEVRAEEQNKAQEAIKKLELEHQAA